MCPGTLIPHFKAQLWVNMQLNLQNTQEAKSRSCSIPREGPLLGRSPAEHVESLSSHRPHSQLRTTPQHASLCSLSSGGPQGRWVLGLNLKCHPKIHVPKTCSSGCTSGRCRAFRWWSLVGGQVLESDKGPLSLLFLVHFLTSQVIGFGLHTLWCAASHWA